MKEEGRRKVWQRLLVFVLITVLTAGVTADAGSIQAAANSEFEIHGTYLNHYRGNKKHVVIPDGITMIDYAAFRDNETIESVVIPDSVTWIGDCAFKYCKRLKKVKLPKSVVKMSRHSFDNTPWFKKYKDEAKDKKKMLIINHILLDAKNGIDKDGVLTIPEGIVTIGTGACVNSMKVKKVICPKSLRYVMTDAFRYAENLSDVEFNSVLTELSIYLSFQNTKYQARIWKLEEPLIENDYLITGQGCAGEVVLPKTLKGISQGAFSNSKITKITIPNSIKVIPDSMFSDCDQLEEVILPKKLKRIEDDAFFGCDKLTKIEIPDSVEWLGPYSFAYTGPIENLRVPDKVTELRDGVFCGCYAESIQLPKNLKYIGYRCFTTSWFKKLHLPKSVQKLDISSFDRMSWLEEINIPSGIKELPYEVLHACTSLREIKIPKSVKKIDPTALQEITHLTIIAAKGTAAEKYAKENKLKYRQPGEVVKAVVKHTFKATDKSRGLIHDGDTWIAKDGTKTKVKSLFLKTDKGVVEVPGYGQGIDFYTGMVGELGEKLTDFNFGDVYNDDWTYEGRLFEQRKSYKDGKKYGYFIDQWDAIQAMELEEAEKIEKPKNGQVVGHFTKYNKKFGAWEFR